jgi:D-alanyl-lipoteichoic acid acyltransferase DltB (MBOAT superfamily)
MIFNSIPFGLFFIVFFSVYWFLLRKKLNLQNYLLLLGSYVFYACWDWRFLFLLIACTFVSYTIGNRLNQSGDKKRKTLLILGIVFEVAVLVYFKYTNFFITNFMDLFHLWGIDLEIHTLKIILPLGISFYIFRNLSYLLDIYYNRIPPEPDALIYFTYIAFFPSLVSGPIDRAKLLIPQLKIERTFDSRLAIDGTRQILWGIFKKAVIADNCAAFTDPIFNNPGECSASTLLVGAFFYTIQLYADFSGYSDMAIGIAKIVGFRITRNFNFPFFAQNIADYWRRWHISLTTWLTDFIFTPVSIRYRDWGKSGLIIAILLTFLVSGIWHGANWTFILWGFLHGCYFIPLILRGTMNKKKKINTGYLPSMQVFLNILGTFVLVMLTNVIFRSNSISDVWVYYRGILSLSLFSVPVINGNLNTVVFLLFVVFMLLCEWLQREKEYGLQIDNVKPRVLRLCMYYGIVLIILFYGTTSTQFIYFQF